MKGERVFVMTTAAILRATTLVLLFTIACATDSTRKDENPPPPPTSPANVGKVTDATFDEVVVKSRLPVLLNFWAEWSQPDRLLTPTIEDISRRYVGKLLVARLNVDENSDTPARYQIHGIPTLVLFKDGKAVGRIVGVVPANKIEELLEKNGVGSPD